MSDSTPHLGLPLLAASQAQKHVTHNEALGLLDALVQLACLDKDLTAPPPSPAEGDRYLVVASNPGGAWAGFAGQVARYADGVWSGVVPKAGWLAYLVDEADLYVFDGAAWTSVRRTLSVIRSVTRLGINTEADSTNRLAVKADAALLTWDDVTPGRGDMRVTLNKKAAANDAALLFQTGYASRALFGTLGGDDVTLKVSPDGASFATALTAAAATGVVAFPASPTAPTPAARDNSARLATTTYVDRGDAAAFARTQVEDVAYTILPGDRTVAVIALTAGRALTLPAASAFPQGVTLTVLDESGACSAGRTVTVACAGSDTLNGLPALTLATPYGQVALQSNGANKWTVVHTSLVLNRPTFVDVANGATTTVGSTFTRIALTRINEDGGGNWDAVNSWYTCPRTGVYQITGSLRVDDGIRAGTQYGVAVHTAEQDGPWFLWHAVGALRSTYPYSRLSLQNAGDRLRMFSFADETVKVVSAGLQICLISDVA